VTKANFVELKHESEDCCINKVPLRLLLDIAYGMG
jgi:hypothetical protein